MRLVRPDGTKIADRDGKTWIFDHGPQTFGGWQGVEAKPGMKLEKSLAKMTMAPGGTMRLKVFAANPGVFLTHHGGAALKPGENEVLLGVLPNDGWFAFEIIEAPPGTMLVLDLQRDYGRTRIDGEKAPGELVARFSSAL